MIVDGFFFGELRDGDSTTDFFKKAKLSGYKGLKVLAKKSYLSMDELSLLVELNEYSVLEEHDDDDEYVAVVAERKV